MAVKSGKNIPSPVSSASLDHCTPLQSTRSPRDPTRAQPLNTQVTKKHIAELLLLGNMPCVRADLHLPSPLPTVHGCRQVHSTEAEGCS